MAKKASMTMAPSLGSVATATTSNSVNAKMTTGSGGGGGTSSTTKAQMLRDFSSSVQVP